jgi:hypothetical protein
MRVPNSAFLGYVIIVNIAFGGSAYWTYIFEAVTRELSISIPGGRWLPQPNFYLHVKNRFPCTVGATRNYSLVGSYFSQQNEITNVCAHACAVMMLANCPFTKDIVAAETLNEILGFNHDSNKLAVGLTVPNDPTNSSNKEIRLGSEGPEWEHLKKIFHYFRYSSHLYEFKTSTHQHRFRSFLYGFVESRFPAVLAFCPRLQSKKDLQHVVAVVGHTLNPHSWLPLPFFHATQELSKRHVQSVASSKRSKYPEFISSLSWVDELIIHDDNYGMQLCLPGHAFKPVQHPDHEMNLNPDSGMGIFPASYNVKLLGHEAERLAMSAFRGNATSQEILKGSYYTERLWSETRGCPRSGIVFRTLLVNWKDYLSWWQLMGQFTGEALALVEMIKAKSSYVWLVEVTEPDLYVGNKSKIIDIIIDSTEEISFDDPSYNPMHAILMMRFPQGVRVPNQSFDKWRTVDGWPLPPSQHLPVFQFPPLDTENDDYLEIR